ncbi:MAG: hypothetical protein WCG31_07600 [Deltaproteobacteria bacterium]
MTSTRFPYAPVLISILGASALVSCATQPISLSPGEIAPSVLVTTVQGGISDGRGRFREIFKEVLSAQCSKLPAGVPCDDSINLWKLSGEPAATGRPAPSGRSGGALRVVVVPGVMAECVADKSMAFGDARARLEELGYETDYIQTGGRQGSDHNADLIRDAVMRMPTGKRLIFVTHSKGAVDTMEALVKYPSIAERTAALLSVSGAVNGSPLAEAFPEFLFKLAHQIPLSSCLQGEGVEAVESLRRNVRISWLSTHQLPKSIRYYSLAAFTSRENTSRILRPFYDILSKTEPLNDGMVICSDAIVPGSVLLGYPNADHFAVAMPFTGETSTTLAWLIDKNDYPRAALIEAAVRFVEEDLAQADPSHPRLAGNHDRESGAK